jgi:guanylate kinase
MSNKQEKIIILGHSGSGKDYLRKGLQKLGLRYSPKFTTRPKRDSEVNGLDYDFIDFDLYIDFAKNNNIKTSETFVINGINWYYGITNENWTNNQIFIMTTKELSQLTREERQKCFVVYLKMDKDVIKQRLLERKDYNDSIERRMIADDKDFEGFVDYDLCLTDSEFEIETVFDLMN